MKKPAFLLLLLLTAFAGCSTKEKENPSAWKLTPDSQRLVSDEKLAAQMFEALDAAQKAGTDPGISKFPVRAATVIARDGKDHVIVGGNTEYQIPEAIHGESSLLNHVTALYGPDATRHSVRFVAFYSTRCSDSMSCGDCRDYQIAATDYEHLLVVCGQASDHTARVRRFTDAVVPEEKFPGVDAKNIPLGVSDLHRLVRAATEARLGGVTLFTSDRHTGAAGLSFSGKTYRAAGADDAAFHYRFPIGGLLQQAATGRDYLIRVILIAGEPGEWPRVNYRDRQYGFEASSFNRRQSKPPILLILTDGRGKFRMTTFEDALPFAFSTANFRPEAVDNFLKSHQPR